ncbi:SAM-dependent methyltransferase [Sphaerisporangium album]|uniref:SAM-dependent methyltransferase n=1 Tax=Sphaerisporangium album TaxID=509200 RepID=A0A367EQW1_9ACTN|nr:SAM-dependent methyltransferase [Sphaerisporangium album]RCG20119.1 SAM-dependent methyltransferase [Sphaerisporangium album]
MTGEDPVVSGFSTTKPNVARMYDYFLGGKDNFAADRTAAAEIVRAAPYVRQRVQENREFLGRAVRHMANAGIRQFVDLGTGLPTQENVHHVAQRVSPGCRVVYVDNDPMVLAHGRALLANRSDTVVIQADLRDPEDVLAHRDLRRLIDLDEPVAVLMLAVLHFFPDTDGPEDVVAALAGRMARGSYMVISHATAEKMAPDKLAKAVQTYAMTSAGSITPRSPERIAGFFEGFELLEPGVVPVARWRPDGTPRLDPPGPIFLGGVARKP